MTRISENSNSNSLDISLSRAKNKMDGLQLKASSLKRLTSPSEDPVGHFRLMALRNEKINNEIFLKNSNLAKSSLGFTDLALKDISEILGRAKEIAIAQSSDIYNPEVKRSIAAEVEQMRKQLLGIANRRMGNRYIFGGHKSLKPPFNYEGEFSGDSKKIFLEVTQDFYVPINVPGNEVFYFEKFSNAGTEHPFDDVPDKLFPGQDLQFKKIEENNPDLSTQGIQQKRKEVNLFLLLKTMELSLKSSNPDAMQNVLEKIDTAIDKTVQIRARVGSLINTISTSSENTNDTQLMNSSMQSMIEDADVAKIFSELQKQKNVLESTYKASSKMLNEGLIQFLR